MHGSSLTSILTLSKHFLYKNNFIMWGHLSLMDISVYGTANLKTLEIGPRSFQYCQNLHSEQSSGIGLQNRCVQFPMRTLSMCSWTQHKT